MSQPPFEQVVASCGPMVLRVCRAVVGPIDAEDAWSETFLAALRAYPELPCGSNIEAWLVTIAHRKAIDILRGNARRAIPVDQLPQQLSREGIPGSRNDALDSALAALPPKQRAALAYHYLAGLPYAEVARVLGNSTDAARRAAADGMATLRKSLTGEDG